MFEPFYIDTQAFRSLAGSNASLPARLAQQQNALHSLASVNPAYAFSAVPDAGCQALVSEINIYVTKILEMHAKAKASAEMLRQVSITVEKTLSYLRETAEDMDQVERSVNELAQDWYGEWINGINRGV